MSSAAPEAPMGRKEFQRRVAAGEMFHWNTIPLTSPMVCAVNGTSLQPSRIRYVTLYASADVSRLFPVCAGCHRWLGTKLSPERIRGVAKPEP